jgi:hypothetical protein
MSSGVPNVRSGPAALDSKSGWITRLRTDDKIRKPQLSGRRLRHGTILLISRPTLRTQQSREAAVRAHPIPLPESVIGGLILLLTLLAVAVFLVVPRSVRKATELFGLYVGLGILTVAATMLRGPVGASITSLGGLPRGYLAAVFFGMAVVTAVTATRGLWNEERWALLFSLVYVGITTLYTIQVALRSGVLGLSLLLGAVVPALPLRLLVRLLRADLRETDEPSDG